MDQADFAVAGGVETVSDVQIKHSPELRQELIKSQKFKSKMGNLASLQYVVLPDQIMLS